MKKSLKDKWVSALRSGQYAKICGQYGDDGNRCAIGVLLDIEGVEVSAQSKADLGDRYYSRIIGMNDYGKSFLEIADWIEKYVPEEDDTTTAVLVDSNRDLSHDRSGHSHSQLGHVRRHDEVSHA